MSCSGKIVKEISHKESGKELYTQEVEVQEFLEEYLRSRFVNEGSVRAVVNRVTEYEKKLHRPFYEFTTDEILQIYKESGAISDRSLQNQNVVLKHFSRWMIDKRNLNITSAFEGVTKADLLPCVNMDKRGSMLLTREQLTEIQEDLLNDTDRAILELLWLGAGGKWLKELTYLNKEQLSLKGMCIYFKTGKIIPIDDRVYVLLQKACNETEILSYNNNTQKVSMVQSLGIYKMRSNTLSKNDDVSDLGNQERRYRWVQRRLELIKRYLELPMTSGSLQTSGLWYNIQTGMKEEGMSFDEYLHTKACKQIAQRYDIYSNLYAQIIKSKFESII